MTTESLLADLAIVRPELTLAIGAMALLLFGAFAGERSTGVVTAASIALLAAAGLVTAAFTPFGEAFTSQPEITFASQAELPGGVSVDAQTGAIQVEADRQRVSRSIDIVLTASTPQLSVDRSVTLDLDRSALNHTETAAALGAELQHGAFVHDPWSRFAKIAIFGLCAIVLLISGRFLHAEGIARFEYPILVVLAALGMSVMVSARDLLTLYMGIELQSLSLYILASFNRDSVRGSEAGLKYFVLGALSSGLLLYGMSLIYGFTGVTRFEGIALALNDGANLGAVFGLVFVICGLAFKVSAAPFHMWTPDVYQGAPTTATTLFASAPKLAAMALLMRLMLEAFPASLDDWQSVIALIAAASMTVGSLGALVQTDLKRLMAYSSIANMGFALVALAAGTENGARGPEGLLIYMAIYVISTTGVFACILAMRRDGQAVGSIQDLAGLSRTHPGLAFALTVLMFSIAGIPPLGGFLGKLFTFMPAWQAGLHWLVIYAVIFSVVAAFYYLRIIRIMWFDEADRPLARAGQELSWTAIVAALMVSVVVLIAAAPARQVVEAASQVFFT